VVFLVDTSDSMLNRPAPARPTRLEEAKGALIQVLRKMTPEAQVQVWSFNTRMVPVPVDGVREGRFIVIGKGNHREQLIEQVRSLRTAGGTNLYSSVVKALAFFAEPRDQALYRAGRRYPVLVVVSDGEDGGKTQETLKTVQEEKGRHPLVTVNTIGFALDREQQWFEVLCRIASRPEGCATADDGAQLQTMLESFYRPLR
jgi:Mg-chelatase subunit ChlD